MKNKTLKFLEKLWNARIVHTIATRLRIDEDKLWVWFLVWGNVVCFFGLIFWLKWVFNEL